MNRFQFNVFAAPRLDSDERTGADMRFQTTINLLRRAVPASLAAVLALYGCSASESSTLDTGTAEFVEHNQKPLLSCSIKKISGNTIGSSRTVSSDPRISRLGDNLIEGDSVLIDCSESNDDSTDPEDLEFELSQDYGQDDPVFAPLSQKNMQSLDMNDPGRPIMALRATDSEGASTTVPFTMVVQCAEGTKPNIDDVSLTVSSTGRLNYYDFKVNASGVGEGLKVSLDFNGDGVFDTPESNKFSTWSTNTTFTKYVQYVGERVVGIKVANACELEASKQVTVNFAQDNLPRNLGQKAERTGFPYVQFNLQADTLRRIGDEAKFLYTTGDVVWSDIKSNSTLKATAVQNYYTGDATDSGTEYRFYANIDGFSDGCSSAGTKTHTANVKELSVVVGGTTDGVAQMFYTAKDVPAEVKVTCLEGSHSCSGGGNGLDAARQLLVTIPSAELTTDDGQTATFEVGLISADRGAVEYSCGSGGCGGGTGVPAQ